MDLILCKFLFCDNKPYSVIQKSNSEEKDLLYFLCVLKRTGQNDKSVVKIVHQN